jgi:hypothetical protein
LTPVRPTVANNTIVPDHRKKRTLDGSQPVTGTSSRSTTASNTKKRKSENREAPEVSTTRERLPETQQEEESEGDATKATKAVISKTHWSPEEDEIVLRNANTAPGNRTRGYHDAAKLLPGRTAKAVQDRFYKLELMDRIGVEKPDKVQRMKWSTKEDDVIYHLPYKLADFKQAADLLTGRSAFAVRTRWITLHQASRYQPPWTPDEIDALLEIGITNEGQE